MALKKIPDSNPGLKALKQKAPDVVKKMGYMKMGGMMKKRRQVILTIVKVVQLV